MTCIGKGNFEFAPPDPTKCYDDIVQSKNTRLFADWMQRRVMSFNHNKEMPFTIGPSTSLAELDSASLAAITQVAVRKSYEKGQIVCLEGEACPGLIIIESGWLSSVKISPQGREQEIRCEGPGNLINEISLMAGNTNLLTVKALEDSIIWVIEQDVFFDLIAKHPMLSNIINQNLAKLTVQLLSLVENLSLRNVEGRLAHLLLSESTDDIVHRRNWSTQEEMASRIGTTSVVISRVLNEMQNQGTIQLERNKIHILDRQKLEQVVFQSNK